MMVRYVCDKCGAERYLIYWTGKKPDDEIPCECGGVMKRQPPRTHTVYKSRGFTKRRADEPQTD